MESTFRGKAPLFRPNPLKTPLLAFAFRISKVSDKRSYMRF